MKKVIFCMLSRIRFSALIVISLLLIVNACKKEDQCIEQYLGDFRILETSESSVPYQQSALLYFVDSVNHEIVYSLDFDDVKYDTETRVSQADCETSGDRYTATRHTVDFHEYDIIENEFTTGVEFWLRLWPVMLSFRYEEPYVVDRLDIISSMQSDAGWSTVLQIVVDQRNVPDEFLSIPPHDSYPEPIQELTLLSKSFTDVYVDADSNLYYNYEHGIVAFRDIDQNLWVLDRTEEIE
jgi:hypothetical protein